jgi:2-alkyl-3-oxoalkanoate reductase
MMEPQAARFRVAIVGAGLISDLHITGLAAIPGVTVEAIVDADASRAQSKAAQYGIARTFTTQREMLEVVRPDVVHILTPPATHADLCVEAVEAGAHVYVEKPMAATEQDCSRMMEAAARAGRELCVGHSLAFDPLLRLALDAIARGEIGDVLHASAVFCFDPRRIPGYNSKVWYRRLAGGFVEDLATHPLSVLLRVLGTPRTVTGVADARQKWADSGVAAVLQAERGTATVLLSLAARPEDVSLEVRGSRGMVSVNFSTMVVAIQPERKLPKKIQHGVRNLYAARDLLVQTVTNTARFLTKRIDTTKGIHTLIAAFYAALSAGKPAPVTPAEGRDVVRILRELWPQQAATEPLPAHRFEAAAREEQPDRMPPSGRMRHALVTGATGFIGSHLVRTLAQRGIRVRALARDPRRAQSLVQPNVDVVIGDFADPETFSGLAEGVDTVFHLASVMTGSADEFEQVDLAGTQRLIDEAKRAGVRRIVFTSTMGAYALAGLADGTVVSEEMVDVPDRVGNYARAKLLIEAMLRSEHEAGHLEAVITRPGLVFGPGASPFLEHLPHLGSLRGDRYIVFGDGAVPLQLTYVENTVEALWLCATVPQAAGQTFTIIDDDLPTQRTFVQQLAALTGRPLRVTCMPKAAAYLIGLGVEALSAVMKKRPPTTRRLLLGKTAKLSFDTHRAKKILGWTPSVRWQEGLRRAVSAAAGDEAHSGPLGRREAFSAQAAGGPSDAPAR